MKKFHEVAVVKDGNKRVGFLLKEGGASTVTPVQYVSEDKFKKLVSANLVQYFVPSTCDRGYDLGYTNEEMANLPPIYNKISNIKDYFKYDMVLRYEELIRAIKGGIPYIYLSSGMRVLEYQDVYGGYVFYANGFNYNAWMNSFLNNMRSLEVKLHQNLWTYQDICCSCSNYARFMCSFEFLKVIKNSKSAYISCKGLPISLELMDSRTISIDRIKEVTRILEG